jgi:hypothetical protein
MTAKSWSARGSFVLKQIEDLLRKMGERGGDFLREYLNRPEL